MQTTATAIIERAYRKQPHLKLAVSASGGAIGSWDASKGRYVMVAGMLLPGIMGPGEQWVNCPMEILIDGKPPVDDWTPVAAPEVA